MDVIQFDASIDRALAITSSIIGAKQVRVEIKTRTTIEASIVEANQSAASIRRLKALDKEL